MDRESKNVLRDFINFLLHFLPLSLEPLRKVCDELLLVEALVHFALGRVVNEVSLVLEHATLVEGEVVQGCSNQKIIVEVNFEWLELQ